MSVRDRPSGWVTGKPSSSTTMLRMPKPLRALEPRIEMPTSRGPLPCLIEMPGLSWRISPIEKAGALVKRLRSTVVIGWPAGRSATDVGGGPSGLVVGAAGSLGGAVVRTAGAAVTRGGVLGRGGVGG